MIVILQINTKLLTMIILTERRMNMREKECYRDNLERLDSRFPNKELLSQKECAEFLGCSPRTIKRNYGIIRITKAAFARLIS